MFRPIDEVIAFAQTITKSADNQDTNVWRAWVYQALLDLGISDDDILVAEVYPQNSVAKLPEGCRQIIDVAVYNSSGQELPHKFRAGKRRIHADVRIAPMTTTGDQGLNSLVPVDISNDDQYIHLGTNGTEVAAIAVRYFAYPIDSNGNPMIREEDFMACVNFIRYMQARREDDNRSKIQQEEIAWFREADRARARKKMSSMTPAKAKTLLKSLMKVVPNFTSINEF